MSFNSGTGSTSRTAVRLGAGYGSGFREIQFAYVGDGSNARLVFALFSGSEVILDETYAGQTVDVPVPAGAMSATIYAYNPGNQGDNAYEGDGSWYPGNGGNGGGRIVATKSFTSADWNQNISCHVGQCVEFDFQNTTLSASLPSGTSIAINVGSATGGTYTSGSGGETAVPIPGGTGGNGGAGVDGHGTGGKGADGNENEHGWTGDHGYIRIVFSP